jgi:hypothetical protein
MRHTRSVRDRVKRSLVAAFHFLQILQIAALDALVRAVAFDHVRLSCLKSTLERREEVSTMRRYARGIVTFNPPAFSSIVPRLAARWINVSQVGQMPRNRPRDGVFEM